MSISLSKRLDILNRSSFIQLVDETTLQEAIVVDDTDKDDLMPKSVFMSDVVDRYNTRFKR